jgi:hypothetical protein
MDELGWGMVITDTSGERDVLHNMVTAQKVFIRFTGMHYINRTTNAWMTGPLEFQNGVQKLYRRFTSYSINARSIAVLMPPYIYQVK